MLQRTRINGPSAWGKCSERMFPFLLLLAAGSLLIINSSGALLWLMQERDVLLIVMIWIGLPLLISAPVLSLVGLAFGERPRWLILVTIALTGSLLILLKSALAHLD